SVTSADILGSRFTPSPLRGNISRGYWGDIAPIASNATSGRAVFRLFLCFPQLGLRASGRNENCGIIPPNMKTKLKVPAVALIAGAALGCVTGFSLSCQRQQESALKPIDKAALQTM